MGLFSKYDTPGMGIPKAPMEKKGFFKFWEIYGRRIWKLVQLNMIFIIACLPVVTFGPAVAGMTKVARNYSQERNAFVWGDFWDTFKKCFKQSFVIGLIDLLIAAAARFGLPVYQKMAEQNSMMYIPMVISISCILLFFMMNFYIYPMIVSTHLTLRQILKNSLFLVSLGFKSSMFTFLAWIVVVLFMFIIYPFSYFLMFVWPFSFMCFVTVFNCYPVIRKYVIQPYYDKLGEENPEFDYLKLKEDEELLCEDNLSLEQPPAKEDKSIKHKGKTIK